MNVTIRHAKHTDIKALVCLLKELFEIEEDFVFEENKQSKGLGGCSGIEAVARENGLESIFLIK